MTTTRRLRVMLGRVVPLLTPRRGADTMGMAAPIYWTADMVRQLPDDGNRYEVGKLADHLGSPIDRRGHAHSIGSSARRKQGNDTPEHDGQAPGCRHRFDVGGAKRLRRENWPPRIRTCWR